MLVIFYIMKYVKLLTLKRTPSLQKKYMISDGTLQYIDI